MHCNLSFGMLSCVSLSGGQCCISKNHSSDTCSAVSRTLLVTSVPFVSVEGGRQGGCFVYVVRPRDIMIWFLRMVLVGPLLVLSMLSFGYLLKVSSTDDCFSRFLWYPIGFFGFGGGGGGIADASDTTDFNLFSFNIGALIVALDVECCFFSGGGLPDGLFLFFFCALLDDCDVWELVDGEWSPRFLGDDLGSSCLKKE